MFCAARSASPTRRTRTRARSASRTRARCRCRTSSAIEHTVKLGLALGCEIAPRALFHRKNYFYPDNPKGYQISQYDVPLCARRVSCPEARRRPRGGDRRARTSRRTRRRTCTSAASAGRIGGSAHTIVDFNRGGTPLVEIVTAAGPPLGRRREALPAAAAADDRRARHLRRGDGEGHVARRRQRLRPPDGRDELPHAYRAEEHELVQLHRARDRGRDRAADRRLGVGRGGRAADVRLRRRDGELTPRRSKEEAEDYRYFPEPDLVPVEPRDALVERCARRGCRSYPARGSVGSRRSSTSSSPRGS